MGEQEATAHVAEAAAAASHATADAIELAAEKNGDPEVAKILDHAARSADATVSRVGWLRSAVHRLLGSGS